MHRPPRLAPLTLKTSLETMTKVVPVSTMTDWELSELAEMPSDLPAMPVSLSHTESQPGSEYIVVQLKDER